MNAEQTLGFTGAPKPGLDRMVLQGKHVKDVVPGVTILLNIKGVIRAIWGERKKLRISYRGQYQ